LIASHWTGDRVITLGTEAFQWFAPYDENHLFEAFWRRDDRYEVDVPCTLSATIGGEMVKKPLVIMPLPHPSPLNARWYSRFPELLAKRLAILAETNC
jgi:uracil-DNA glycosylase